MELYKNLHAGEKGAYLSIAAYICLSALKLTVGFLGDSQALRADGFNNTTDIIASIAVLIGLRISQLSRPIIIINTVIYVQKPLPHSSLHL